MLATNIIKMLVNMKYFLIIKMSPPLLNVIINYAECAFEFHRLYSFILQDIYSCLTATVKPNKTGMMQISSTKSE